MTTRLITPLVSCGDYPVGTLICLNDLRIRPTSCIDRRCSIARNALQSSHVDRVRNFEERRPRLAAVRRDVDESQFKVIHSVGIFCEVQPVRMLILSSVVDSLLLELLDPNIRLTLNDVVAMKGGKVRYYIYERPFDQHRIAYLLDILLQLINFGGQNFGRIAATTLIARSPNRELATRVQNGK